MDISLSLLAADRLHERIQYENVSDDRQERLFVYVCSVQNQSKSSSLPGPLATSDICF